MLHCEKAARRHDGRRLKATASLPPGGSRFRPFPSGRDLLQVESAALAGPPAGPAFFVCGRGLKLRGSGRTAAASIRRGVVIVIERDARELALEVLGVGLAVSGIVQDGVDVVEYGVLGEGPVRAGAGRVVLALELGERPVGDVFCAACCWADARAKHDSAGGGTDRVSIRQQ